MIHAASGCQAGRGIVKKLDGLGALLREEDGAAAHDPKGEEP
jgi:hypothetical protein